MVVQYTVFGRQVGAHYLSMATLGTVFGGIYLAVGGSGQKKSTQAGPPINATSKDEENFIQEFLKNADADERKAKH